MNKKTDVTVSSGNIFQDLGLPQPDEALAKADLAIQIRSIAKHRHLTQSETAELLGTTQPKVSELFAGKLAGFSMERLIKYLMLLNRDVTLVVAPKPRSSDRATFRVVKSEMTQRDLKITSGQITSISVCSDEDDSPQALEA